MTDEQYRRICSELRTIILLLAACVLGVGWLVWNIAPPDWLI